MMWLLPKQQTCAAQIASNPLTSTSATVLASKEKSNLWACHGGLLCCVINGSGAADSTDGLVPYKAVSNPQ